MKNILFITFLLSTILFGCNLPDVPEIKELSSESKKIYDSVIKELDADNIEYSYKGVNDNGDKKLYFKMRIEGVKNRSLTDADFEKKNKKILSVFDKSNFDFLNVDEYIFYYYNPGDPFLKLRIFFRLNSHRKTVEVLYK